MELHHWGAVDSSPAVANGVVCADSEDGKVYASTWPVESRWSPAPATASRLRAAPAERHQILTGPDHPHRHEALGAIARRMHELVTRPEFGFLSSKDYRGADGDALTINEFEDLEGLERWRTEPEHLAAQRRGPEFFGYLVNEVCVVKRRDPMGSVPLDA